MNIYSFISDHITIYNRYYLLSLPKTWFKTKKTYCLTKYIKMENNEIKRISIKNRTCYYFDGIIKIEDFDVDNILIDEKSFENILVYNILYKTLIGPKPLRAF